IRDLIVTGVQTCALPISFATPVVLSILLLAAVSVTLNFLPPISSPYVTFFVGSAFTVITPSLTTRSSTGTPKRFDAISSRTRRRSEERRVGKERRHRMER